MLFFVSAGIVLDYCLNLVEMLLTMSKIPELITEVRAKYLQQSRFTIITNDEYLHSYIVNKHVKSGCSVI